MTARAIWRSEQPSYEQPIWSSQRPATPPSFHLRTPDDRDLDAVTWTRATTKSVTDYQGNIWQALSGEVPWEGYRRVQNLAQASANLSGTGWTLNAATASTSTLLLATAATAVHYALSAIVSAPATGTAFVCSVDLKKYSDTWVQVLAGSSPFANTVWANVNLDTGAFGNKGSTGTWTCVESPDDSTYWRVSFAATTTASLSASALIVCFTGDADYNGRAPSVSTTTANGVYINRLQIQLARLGQTTPDEYVSVGVLSTPYHGAKVDGVKYFSTDDQGRLIDGTRGYKRITNFVVGSEDLTAGSPSYSGDLTTTTWHPTTVNGSYYYKRSSRGANIGETWIVSATISCDVERQIGLRLADSDTGVIESDTPVIVTTTPTRYYLTLTMTSTSGLSFGLDNRSGVVAGLADTSTTGTFTITDIQFEVAEQGQTTPSTYVPTNGAAVTLMEESSTVTPIAPGLSIGSLQTNRITYSSDLTSGWTDSGAGTRTAAYDAQVGVYTQLRSVGASGADDFLYAATGFTGSARTEPAMMLRAVSTSGSLVIENASDNTLGKWTVNLSLVSTTRFERLDRFHAAVTVHTEFTATAGGAAGIRFYVASGSVGFDVSLVTQVEGTLVDALIYTAGSATTKNADYPLAVLPTGNANTIVADYTYPAPAAVAEAGVFQANNSGSSDILDARAEACYGVVGVGGVNQAVLSFNSAQKAGRFRVAVRGARDNFALIRTGNTLSTDVSGTVPAINQLQLGGLEKVTDYNLRGVLHSISVYPAAVTDIQLQALVS